MSFFSRYFDNRIDILDLVFTDALQFKLVKAHMNWGWPDKSLLTHKLRWENSYWILLIILLCIKLIFMSHFWYFQRKSSCTHTCSTPTHIFWSTICRYNYIASRYIFVVSIYITANTHQKKKKSSVANNNYFQGYFFSLSQQKEWSLFWWSAFYF